MKRFLITAATVCALASPAMADDAKEAIENALEAYNQGDIQYALEELNFATQILQGMKSQSLSSFLPEAPDGWQREVDTEFAGGMAFMGGGVGAMADYSGGGDSFSVTIMSDNPMVASMAPLIANPALMGGKLVRIGREKFIRQDEDMMGLIGNRVLVQVSGGDPAVVEPLLESMDLRALANFGN